MRAWTTYEAVMNVAFASSALSLICLYDIRTCPKAVVDIARKTHPYVRTGEGPEANEGYVQPTELLWKP